MDDSEDGATNNDNEPGFWDIAATELSMSFLCEEDLDWWEDIALWLLGEPEGLVDNPADDREVATAVVLLPYLCDYWRANGNQEFAALTRNDPDAQNKLEEYFDEIGRDAIRAEIDRVETELPKLRATEDLLDRLDKVTDG